jgi:hypothetical protein
MENTASSCCLLDQFDRAVAWQRVDQIRYNIYHEAEVKLYLISRRSGMSHEIRVYQTEFLMWYVFNPCSIFAAQNSQLMKM